MRRVAHLKQIQTAARVLGTTGWNLPPFLADQNARLILAFVTDLLSHSTWASRTPRANGRSERHRQRDDATSASSCGTHEVRCEWNRRKYSAKAKQWKITKTSKSTPPTQGTEEKTNVVPTIGKAGYKGNKTECVFFIIFSVSEKRLIIVSSKHVRSASGFATTRSISNY